MKIAFFFSLASAFSASCALANDSTAELATGGLKFLKDPDIAMKSEDLFISAEAVRVAYVFLNGGAADKTALIAFPMPDITGSQDFTVGIPGEDPENPFNFRVKADGAEVALALQGQALFNGADVTKKLKAWGVPLAPWGDKTAAALDKVPPAAKAELLKLGMAYEDEFTDKANGPMEKHLGALWTYRSAFTWTQVFPAGKPLNLEQSYAPSVGGTAVTSVGSADWRKKDYLKDYPEKYCIDGDLDATLTKARIKAKGDLPPFGEQRIDYVLTTGANWAGPIGDFHLTIDKGKPSNLVSFCADGVKKTGATQFEVRKTDFTPKKDLNILILTPQG